MKLRVSLFFTTITLLSLAACSSDEGSEFIDNSDEINKEFGVTNKIDDSWLESLKTSELALAFDLVESIEYIKNNGKWEVNTGECPYFSKFIPGHIDHWTPKNIVFKDGLIYASEFVGDFIPNDPGIQNLCYVAYQRHSGLTPIFYHIEPMEYKLDPSIPAIKKHPRYQGYYNIVELSNNNLLIKEEHESCFSLTKYRFSPYFEFADGIYGTEIRFIGNNPAECRTKFFEEFKKHFGDKVNLTEILSDYKNSILLGDTVISGEIDIADIEEYLKQWGLIL